MTETQFRCPECDTYSGTFTVTIEDDEVFSVTHSLCGREGLPESFTRGTEEYERIYGGWD